MMKNAIVIPRGFRKTKMHEDHNIKYFIPRIVSIKCGETITWINKDSESHHLISEDIESGKPDGIFNSGIIPPRKYYSKKFDASIGLIRYYCVIHPAERGFIIINDMLLGKTNDIKILNLII
jgi:plastocyanin